MHGSIAFTRYTRPAGAVRNFDGTVSRFFASSVCSKVPWNAKAHAVGPATGVSRTAVAEWEEPRHHGPAVTWGCTPLCPTLQHLCRLPSHFGGQYDRRAPDIGPAAGLSRWENSR